MDRVQPGRALGPADRVTAVRAVLAAIVAGLVVSGLLGASYPVLLVGLATIALLLDAVDGHVARRTATVSAFGARFDMEVDAFLIAVLSVHAAPEYGWWVLAIGAMRYAYVVAGWLLPWLRRATPPRYAAKVVAAIQGIVLTVAAAGVLPMGVTRLGLAVALLLLVDSFGRDIWWQWRHRREEPVPPRPAFAPVVATAAAAAGLWVVLVPPGGAVDLLRIPVEGLALVALALVLPGRWRSVVAAGFGLVLAGLLVLRALDVGFQAVLDRSFRVVGDWSYLGKGVDVLGDTVGETRAALVLVVVVLAVAAAALLLPVAAVRVSRVAAEHRRRTAQTLVALGTVWVLCTALGAPADRVAAASSVDLAADTVEQVRADLRDRSVFAAELADDAYAGTPTDQLLTALRGKDVLLVWVESYGRVAVEDSWFAPDILAALGEGEERLAGAGYGMRSAFLTSPTYGAASWLAHGTLQAGVWVDGERRYRQLLDSDRTSLTSAFGRAGWRTVFDVPANTRDWPEGAAYYGFDELYDSRDVGYEGPEFGYASMPDQYTLEHFRRTELAPADRPPVFAEIDLISSHHPWTPLPDPVPWDEVGDGSVYDGMPERGEPAVDGVADPRTAQRYYAASIRYTWRTLVSFLTTYPDPDRVLVVVGDHQPHSFVSGDDAGHDVPVSVIAQDPAVLRRIDGWRWQDELVPGPDAPVWRMDAFRDRFLAAYGDGTVPTAAEPQPVLLRATSRPSNDRSGRWQCDW